MSLTVNKHETNFIYSYLIYYIDHPIKILIVKLILDDYENNFYIELCINN